MTDEKETPQAEEASAPEGAAEAAGEPLEAEKPPAKPAAKPPEERYSRGQLQRLTTKKLREIALELGEVAGVHGMKKDELQEALFKLRGVEEADAAEAAPAIDKSALKSEIKDLKVRRDSAIETGDSVELKRVRKRIKRLKRSLRQAS